MVSLACGLLGEERRAFFVPIDEDEYVDALKDAIKVKNGNRIKCDAPDLKLYLAKKEDGWFPIDDLETFNIEYLSERNLMKPLVRISRYFGRDFEPGEEKIHVIVVLPPPETPSPAAPPPSFLKQTTFLPAHFNTLKEECIKLPTWEAGTMHEIPQIWDFMKALGGCTSSGEILWRLEEQKVLSLILDLWHQAIPDESSFATMDLRTIVRGSPGIGKSTMLVLMAFYMYFKYKINVLIYRIMGKRSAGNCLLYLGYEGREAVYCAWEWCTERCAITIVEQLNQLHGVKNVFLCLDGFIFKELPEGLKTFTLLATSQQPDVKSQFTVATKRFLLPSWSKKDLFFLGENIYRYTREDMGERYAISGGNVRDFTRQTLEEIKEEKDYGLQAVPELSVDYTHDESAKNCPAQIDRVRGTYIRNVEDPKHYTDPIYSFQFIDSEYVLEVLLKRLPPKQMRLIYEWAKSAGDPVLAGLAFEKYIHCLASNKMLSLHISDYTKRGKRDEAGCLAFEELPLEYGLAMQKGTRSDYEQCLSEWRDDGASTYWFPACRNFPNIDSIVKCALSPDQGHVAYLQITVASEHAVDPEQLKRMNAIFLSGNNPRRPIYLAVCPDEKSCQSLTLKVDGKQDVEAAKSVCPLFVGYFGVSSIHDSSKPKRARNSSQ